MAGSVTVASSSGTVSAVPQDEKTIDSLTHEEVAELRADDTVVFGDEKIIIEEPALFGPFGDEVLRAPGSDDWMESSGFTAADAFTLNSRPSADTTIYLDFDGQTVDDGYWNDVDGTPIVADPYSRESRNNINTTISDYEREGIVEVWERVAEDFAPWDVNVTTEDPGIEALRKTSSSDAEFGMRVIITPSYDWYSANRYGGVAGLYTFGRSADVPSWVFSSNLGNGHPKSVAEAASHEVGHTLGLRHDGVTTVDPDTGAEETLGYYVGHGDWAPIMGVGYYRTVTQWSKGEYAGATQQQDDLTMIDSYLARRDESGASASGALGTEDSEMIHVITDGGDTERHTLTINGFPATIEVEKVDAEGNLLAEMTVRGPSGDVIATVAPGDESFWSLSTTLPAGSPTGTYTVDVRSIGWGTVDNGFSAYASMGEYVLAIDVPVSDTPTTTTVPPTTTTPTTSTTVPQTSTTIPSTTTSTTVPPTSTTTTSTTTTSTTTTSTTIAPSTTVAPTTTAATTTTTVAPTSTAPTTQPPTTQPPTTQPPTTQPPTTPETTAGDRLTAITPARLVDTRLANSPISGRLSAGDNIRVSVDVAPDGASAAIVNVVAVNPSSSGFISLTPCNTVSAGDRTSSLNLSPGRNIANSVIVPLSGTGDICIYSSTSTHVIADVTGWIGDGGELALDALDANRVVDTRSGLGISARLAPGRTTVIDLADDLAGTDIEAVAVNVTVIRAAARGFITLDDCQGSTTSSLNFEAGEVRGNNGVFALGSDQQLCLRSTATTHVTVDVTGQFGRGDGLTFVAAEPERLLDTRGVGRLNTGASTSFGVPTPTAENGFALAPRAASINLTAARHPTGGFITSWNCGPRPNTSALNTIGGSATANGALVSLSKTGRSCLFHDTGGHLIVDLAGWWV